MKNVRIELQKIKSMTLRDGQVEALVDALVVPLKDRGDGDDGLPSSVLAMTEQNLRVLALLIKQQLADIDARKPRSRRSGRA